MGNWLCPVADVAQMAALAQNVCPFPDYNSSPLLFNMLSINSSVHLKDHYKAVQSSLTPTQLKDFTKRLRTTFGREGKVIDGGFGVVALSLAVLFDTLASKVKGECVSDQEIPGLFLQDLSGSYPPQIYTVSKFLRLVPRIANNPARMRQQTERYLRQLITEREAYEEQLKLQRYTDDITELNIFRLNVFLELVSFQLHFLTNDTVHLKNTLYRFDQVPVYNLNCDPEVASVAFMAEAQKSDQLTQEAFTTWFLNTENKDKPVLHQMVERVYYCSRIFALNEVRTHVPDINELREDFDLKAHALGKWA